MTDVVREALVRSFGSLKAAAITFGMDQGQLTRELQTGDFKFRRLEGHDEVKACIAYLMAETYSGTDPGSRMRQAIREAKQKLDEVDELIARVA